MAERKGRSTEEAPGKEERKKKRPECLPYLRGLIDALVSALLKNCQAWTTPTEARKSARSTVEFVLSSSPNADTALRGFIWLSRKEKGMDDFIPEPPRDYKRRWLDFLQKELIEGSLEDVKRICNDFDAKVTDEQAREILTAAWDRRGIEAYGDLQELIEGRDREYLRWAERHYNSRQATLFADPHLRLATLEIGVVRGVLDALRAENKKRDEQKKQEGFTRPHVLKKKGGEGLRQQAFWNGVVKRLVDVVHPLLKVGTGGRAYLWTRTYDFIARLLNACYPDVWPKDFKKGAELIKQRHYRTS